MSNAGIGRGCSAEAVKPSGALPSLGEIAVQKPAGWQEHCKPESELQCRSRKAVRSTASWSWDCSTKAGKLPRALQAVAGISVQKPASRQEHCKPVPREQYRSPKEATSTARSEERRVGKEGRSRGSPYH